MQKVTIELDDSIQLLDWRKHWKGFRNAEVKLQVVADSGNDTCSIISIDEKLVVRNHDRDGYHLVGYRGSDFDLIPVDLFPPIYRSFTPEEIVARCRWRWRKRGATNTCVLYGLWIHNMTVEFSGDSSTYTPAVLLTDFECFDPTTRQWVRAGIAGAP